MRASSLTVFGAIGAHVRKSLISGKKLSSAASFAPNVSMRLPDAETAIARVASRVQQGGHDILEPVIRRRFASGLLNFNTQYKQAVNDWALYNNSGAKPLLLEWEENR